GVHPAGAQGLQQRQPVQLGKHAVEDDGVVPAGTGLPQPFLAVAAEVHGKARFTEHLFQVRAHDGVILDDENLSAHGGTENTAWKSSADIIYFRPRGDVSLPVRAPGPGPRAAAPD